MEIRLATTDEEIERCYPVMAELRPHVPADQFLPRARRQMESASWFLAYLESDGGVTAVAGFRLSENLAWGRYLYVDDLVTAESARSEGHGSSLLLWLIDHARARDCDELHLDSGVQRFAAHRFYLQHRMDITSHHFAIALRPGDTP